MVRSPHRRGVGQLRGNRNSVVRSWALALAAGLIISSIEYNSQRQVAFDRNLFVIPTVESLGYFYSDSESSRHPSNKPNSIKERRHYCDGVTDFFELSNLDGAVEEAVTFHNLGGAIKSVSDLLDSNIDATVKKLGARFIPNGAKDTEGTQEVTAFLKDYYAKNYDPRGGYGKPLPGRYEPDNIPLIHGGRLIEVADPVETRERWDSGLGPIGPSCESILTLGPPRQDGTKWYCQPKQVVNELSKEKDSDLPLQVTQTLPQPKYPNCHIISIGSNGNWKFELSIMEKMEGCVTHTFDCTLSPRQRVQQPIHDRIHFYDYCIDSHRHKDEHGREYLPYLDILKMANLTAPPTLLKIDVEGFEFDIFSNMIQEAEVWLPQQIIVELHWATRMTGVSWMPRTKTTAEIALLSNMMYTGGGYLPIFQDFNRFCPSCMEVLYFRTLC